MIERLLHTSSGSAKKDKISFLPFCVRLCKDKTSRKNSTKPQETIIATFSGLNSVCICRHGAKEHLLTFWKESLT